MSEDIPVLPPHPQVAAPAPAKHRVWPVFVAFGALVVLEVIAANEVVAAIAISKYGTQLAATKFDDVAKSATGLLGNIACSMAIIAGIALGGAWLSPVRWRDRLCLHWVPLRLPILITGTLGIVSTGMIVTACMNLGWIPGSPWQDALDRMLKNLSLGRAIMVVPLLDLLPALVEEMLFRGYIQTRLVARWGATWGVFLTALMFGTGHLDEILGLRTVVNGCIYGFITVRTRSIVPAIICHAANNTISTLMVGDTKGRTDNLLILFLCLVILPLAIFNLSRSLPPAKVTATA